MRVHSDIGKAMMFSMCLSSFIRKQKIILINILNVPLIKCGFGKLYEYE
jgi:hypothetical protein